MGKKRCVGALLSFVVHSCRAAGERECVLPVHHLSWPSQSVAVEHFGVVLMQLLALQQEGRASARCQWAVASSELEE